MRIDLLTSDCPGIAGGYGGGVATFLDHLTALLAPEGDRLRIVLVQQQPRPMSEEWRAVLRERGVETVCASASRPAVQTYPAHWPLRLCEEVTRHLVGADVVYMQDWGGFAHHAIRTARFAERDRPCFVNVLHGASGWVRSANEQPLEVPGHLVLDHLEAYAHRHGDFVASPTRYMLAQAAGRGWASLPPERTRVLGLPWTGERPAGAGPDAPGAAVRRLVHFGRHERRKGIGVFVGALQILAREQPALLRGLEEVVLLGRGADSRSDDRRSDAAAGTVAVLAEAGLVARCVEDLDSRAAVRWLTEHAAGTLAVVPSLVDNHPYTVVEASLVPGLDLICSSAGGIPEILGERGAGQLFEPTPRALAAELAGRLERGTVPDGERGHYAFESANARWLGFHREVREFAARRARGGRPAVAGGAVAGTGRRGARTLSGGALPGAPARTVSGAALPGAPAGTGPEGAALDVCIPYHDHAAYLPQALLSLQRQTRTDFHVIVVDDGSRDPEARRVFDEQRALHEPRGWTFLRQENAFVDAARNAAARHGRAGHVCFLDADDVAAPTLVERLLDGIGRSGADCLMTCYTLFEGDGYPLDPTSGALTAPALAHKRPLAVDLRLSLVDPDVLGSPVMIVRREAFEEVGGFTEIPGAGHEDYELFIKLALAGRDVDVLPEHLHYKREVSTGLSKVMRASAARRRVIDAYEERLAGVGLGGLAEALHGAARQVDALKRQLAGRPGGPKDGQDPLRREAPAGGLRRLYRDWVPTAVRRPVGRARRACGRAVQALHHAWVPLGADLGWRWRRLAGRRDTLDDGLRARLDAQRDLPFEVRRAAYLARVRRGPSVAAAHGCKATVLLPSYLRMENIAPIAAAALRCEFVERVIVSNDNPAVDIRDWVDGSDPRLRLVNHPARRGCGHRWRLAAGEAGAEYFLVVDDDILIYPEQLEVLFRGLVEQPAVPHGYFGGLGPAPLRVPRANECGRELEVDVLHQVYAVTRRHVQAWVRSVERIAASSPALAEMIESGGDDLLISRCGAGRPRLHDLGPVLRCPTSNAEGIAVYLDDGFRARRARLDQAIEAALRSPDYGTGTSTSAGTSRTTAITVPSGAARTL